MSCNHYFVWLSGSDKDQLFRCITCNHTWRRPRDLDIYKDAELVGVELVPNYKIERVLPKPDKSIIEFNPSLPSIDIDYEIQQLLLGFTRA